MHNDLAQFIGRACATCMFCQLNAFLASARIDTSHIGHVATVHVEHVLHLTIHRPQSDLLVALQF